ncbi:hypothetical protein [Microlunatus parietis]|uniref:PH domain-containing protein n=1 Tax=Microlunatus parietis TaxID=682979 RepID=A0A7Y9I7N9_9ACTN|nr:hypothetical protein [Microlunatus parietis]NYE71814.1 hypothetical protein [Microlunatus parietis]
MNGASYEARHGITPKNVLVIVIGLGFVALGVWLLDRNPIVAIASILFFGACAVTMIISTVMVWGKPALRVDANGVLLGRLAFHGPASSLFVPWSEIGAVVLFRQHVGPSRPPYLGLDGRTGPIAAPPLRGFGPAAAHFVPHVPPWVIAVSRPISGWTLDRPALERALAAYAPDVALVDLG